jgi:hypothetical protein
MATMVFGGVFLLGSLQRRKKGPGGEWRRQGEAGTFLVPKKSGPHGLDKEKKMGQRRDDGFGRSSK